MTKFQIGKTYSTRSICDYDTIISVTIAKRTEKTVTTAQGDRMGDGKTFRISVYDGAEFIRPWGRYSMCPIINANNAR